MRRALEILGFSLIPITLLNLTINLNFASGDRESPRPKAAPARVSPPAVVREVEEPQPPPCRVAYRVVQPGGCR
jgi:hypothetical protein